jgi:Tol biopolymer transport system component
VSSSVLARSVVRTVTHGLIALAGMVAVPHAGAQQLSLVSVSPGGTASGALADSIIAFTPDEQYVAFCSMANSLDPTKTDTNGIADVYRRHLPTGITTLVSVNTTGTTAGNGGCPGSGYVRISTDGRYVAFVSEATNLVSGITDTTANDIFVRDMQTGTTSLATVNAAGTAAAGTNSAFDFSDDGRRVVFESYATTLVAGFVDGNGAGDTDVFQRDLQANTTRLISASVLGPAQGGNGSSWLGTQYFNLMSADGRYVAFLSTAPDLIVGHATLGGDLFVRDTQTSLTKLGDDANPFTVFNLTADGRFLAFNENSSSNWVRDLETNARIHVSVNATNTGEANGNSTVPFISRYPRTPGQLDYVVAFRSNGSDLVSGVTKANGPGASTLYARTLGPGGTTVLVGGIPDGTATGNGDDFTRDISPDGRYVVFSSSSSNIVSGLTDTGLQDLFRRDLVTNTTIVVSAAQPSGAADGLSSLGRAGQNGGVAFLAAARLLSTDQNFADDIYFFGVIPDPSISGTVTASNGGAPLADVTLTLTGTSGGAATTSSAGTYTFSPLTANGTYTVTPSRTGFTFAPASRTFANILGAQTADFVGTAVSSPPPTFTISGQVRDLNDTGVAGVTMTLTGSSSATLITDLDGRYAFTGLAQGGTFTVTPSRSTFTFTPPSQTFANLQRDEVAAFFVANVGTFTRYFAEGATGEFFDTTIALLNATGSTSDVTVRFLKEDGTQTSQTLTMAGLARATVDPEQLAGTAAASFATVIESTQPIIADRRMEWDATHYGSHGETSIARPETTWYLAEGATTSAFNLYYLLQNPHATQAAEVEIRYLRPSPLPPIVKTYTVPPSSRRTIYVNGEDPGLDEAEISAVVRATNGIAIIVERAMYTNAGGLLFGAGHESAGIPNLATQWFLAEGATGPFFHLFILIANPNAEDARIDARYLLPDGQVITKQYVAAANSRFTIGVHAEGPELANTPLSTTVTSTNGVPVLVERAMWWPAFTPEWHEGHNSAGVVASGEKWGLADGENGSQHNAQTFILIANTSAQTANVEVTLIFEDGTKAVKTYAIGGNSRFSVHVPGEFPEAQNRRFGAVVESMPGDGGQSPRAQIVVERSVYSDAAGVVFAAGSNAPGTKLR